VSPRSKRLVSSLVSFALAAALLAFFLRKLDLKMVGGAIGRAHLGWLVLATVLSILVIPIRSWRWVRLLRRVGKVGQLEAYSATSIGFAATALLPARAGEIVRPAALAHTSRLPFAPLLASVGLERLLDLVTVVALFIVYAIGWTPEMAGSEQATFHLIRRSTYVLGAGTLVGLVLFAALAARPEWADRLLNPVLARLPERFAAKLGGFVRSFLGGLGAVRSPAEIAVVAVSSAVLWLVICFQIWAVMLAFDIRLPFPVSFFVLTWGVLGLAIPTPGGMGGYHTAVAYSLAGFYAVERNTAAALAIVLHGISFVPITIIGLLFLAFGGLSLRTLRAEAESAAADRPGGETR